jgi:MFS-type transporter involved in bile tolerance (Atg22 family)
MSVPDPYAALRIAEYRRFISARVCITVAIQIQAVVVGWQVYELTKDPLSLGLIGLAEALTSITVSLYAGHIADIVQRKKIIVTYGKCAFSMLCCVAFVYN